MDGIDFIQNTIYFQPGLWNLMQIVDSLNAYEYGTIDVYKESGTPFLNFIGLDALI